MKEPSTGVSFESRFVEQLERLRDNNGAMAALRRGVGKPPGTAAEMHRYVIPWLGENDSGWNDDRFYLVASLFSLWHQGTTNLTGSVPFNLGASYQRLADESGSTEKRFVALLNSHRDDLPHHLRYTVSILRSKGVPINWTQLLADLRGWDWRSRSVQRDWARGFWGGTPASDLAGEPKLSGE